MTPFLYRIAQAFYERYGHDISQLAFVFPNRRSGIFFQKYLADQEDRDAFAKAIETYWSGAKMTNVDAFASSLQ